MKKELKVSTLEDVRTQIDRIDAAIVKLLAERQCYVKEASRFKNSARDVRAPERVELVINRIRSLATEAGLNDKLAEDVYRTLINGFIKIEQNEFDKIQKQ